MKSIKYTAIAYLLAGAMSIQAMDNNNNNQLTGAKRSCPHEKASPFSTMSSAMQLQIADQFKNVEALLTQQTEDAYDRDMQKLKASLESTYDNDKVQFPKENCYRIGSMVYFINRTKYVPTPGSSTTGVYLEDDETVRQIKQHISYQVEQSKGQSPQFIAELPAQMGKLAHILFARALLSASARDNGSTPDDIRASLITAYTEYSKTKRLYSGDRPKTSTPVSDQHLDKELKALKEIKFDCTPKNIEMSVIQKLSPLLHLNPDFPSLVPTYRDYLLQKASAQYCGTKHNALIQQLRLNHLRAFGNGV